MQRSTSYIVGFAALVCLVCSVFVAGSAVALKDKQEQNKVLDRQEKVLSVAGLLEEGKHPSPAEVQRIFGERIRARVIELKTGVYVDSMDSATYDQRKAKKDPKLSSAAPPNAAKVNRLPTYAVVYQVMEGEQVSRLILPIEGKGLWSTLYGFLALDKDTQTIQGITFYEHGETPGLGGEVENPRWRSLWVGRKAFGPDGKPQIEVKKGSAGTAEEDPFHVDGLSGATITSRGVTYLVQFWLSEQGFGPYLERFRRGEA